MSKAALVLGLLALFVGVFGAAMPAREYAKVHRAFMVPRADYNSPRFRAIDERRTELRGRCQLFAVGSLGAAVAALVLAFLAKRKEGSLPMGAVAPAVLGLIASIVIFSHDVF